MSIEYDEKTKASAELAAEDSNSNQGEMVNASGHKQELERNFSLLSICAVAVTTGNTWIAQGGSVVTALGNGGLAGTIYEFIAVSMCYWLVAASIAELASGMPSSSGVYHWATITAGRYGRVCGFFAGWWNCLAWILGAASMSFIMGQQVVSISNFDVWGDFDNKTGYTQPGFVFVLGMLNGAYSVGTPDCSTHLAEEIPKPSRNIPKAVLAQMGVGFITGVCYMVAIFYSIQNRDDVANSKLFPLAEIYRQATGTGSGAVGLLVIAFIPTMITAAGCYITAGRTLWTISRDRATPFPNWIGHISTKFQNPFNATLVCGCTVTILACIYMGSQTAFQAFVGCFAQLSSLSYFMAIFPHILSRRSSFVPGYFFMNNKIGFVVNTLACIYIIAFVIIFCFPFTAEFTAQDMNYASLMTGGLSIFVAIWWFIRQGSYEGPKNIPITDKHVLEDAK
ncbi:hypothetical protein N7509_011714 [Penicillium cosmopolitanum]|uniref:Choline transport protein n=1 Tax=Penicillium cosmopolitanum TaxID=1131564 RepID=A0A9W9VGF3_9EURO|nr:uncharacterized protein N7509_011714 [Penicillium cosmopolitanum]KAJ5378595.1 hypothetical protein N7509_011714 [Penicillium cosmopolitanum]